MFKPTLKRHLQSLTKEQVIDFVLQVYDSVKPAKEMLEKYRKIIVQEFYPTAKSAEPKTRFSVCKKAIADFRALKPSPELLADLMLTLAENAANFTYDYGDMWEQYYISAENNFDVGTEIYEEKQPIERI